MIVMDGLILLDKFSTIFIQLVVVVVKEMNESRDIEMNEFRLIYTVDLFISAHPFIHWLKFVQK